MGTSYCAIAGKKGGNIMLPNGMEIPLLYVLPGGVTYHSVNRIMGNLAAPPIAGEEQHSVMKKSLINFILHTQHLTNKRGVSGSDRAINYAINHALASQQVFSSGYSRGLSLGSVTADPSPLAPSRMALYDVRFTFFNPKKPARRIRYSLFIYS